MKRALNYLGVIVVLVAAAALLDRVLPERVVRFTDELVHWDDDEKPHVAARREVEQGSRRYVHWWFYAAPMFVPSAKADEDDAMVQALAQNVEVLRRIARGDPPDVVKPLLN